MANKKASGFVTLQSYTRFLLKMNSTGTLSASRFTLSTQTRQLTINQTVRLQQEAEGKEMSGPNNGAYHTTAVITLYNSQKRHYTRDSFPDNLSSLSTTKCFTVPSSRLRHFPDLKIVSKSSE